MIILGVFLSSCRDELLYDNSIIGEGESKVSVSLSFTPMGSALDTRSEGQAVKNINNLCVVIYKSNGEFYDKFMANELTGYTCDQVGNTQYPTDTVNYKVEDSNFEYIQDPKTPKAKFDVTLPYGKYRIYAVANMGMLSDDITENEETLKSHRVSWNPEISSDNGVNGEGYNGDHAMFGFFTLADDSRSVGFSAPELVINKPNMNLHCWIKRVVSKVTIAFDTRNLKESVSIYIRSVTIHDIPNECTIGENNCPQSSDDLIADGETLYYGEGADSESSYKSWMRLWKGSGIVGTHTEGERALYFFENMQGNYQGQKDFLKTQIANETGMSINEPAKDDDGNIILNDNGNMATDFKDRIRYGSYIEVVGYYQSANEGKISQGPIKYRFMLGKNTTYNYDAERNFHYKLTLKFRGWANEADWHIVYDEITPTIMVTDPYYISYLYNQDMTYPVRLTGIDYIRDNNLHLHAQIIKNNWVPTIEKTGALADEISGAYNNLDGFAWNKWAYEHTYNGVNYAGFLSLRENKQIIVGPDQTYGVDGNDYLRRNYEGIINVTPRYYADYDLNVAKEGLGVSGSTSDGTYDVVATDDKSVTVLLPMYTRPKELIPASDFSGNNPFYAYVREATVRFSLRRNNAPDPTNSTASGYSDAYDITFKVKDQDGNEKDVKYVDVTIYQVPRIVNPKAIWRRSGNNEKFHVQIMQLDAAGASSFHTFESIGPWRATIIADPGNLIKLYTDDGQELTKKDIDDKKKLYIEGVTGTEADFWYEPIGSTGANDARCGIIQVEYHNYTCKHLIFVRQGYDKGVKLGNATWSCYNAYAAGSNSTTQAEDINSTNVVVTTSPLSIGSLFKRCNYNYAIRESNNESLGWLQNVNVNTSVNNLSTAYRSGNTYATRTSRWSAIAGYPWSSNRGTKPTGPQNQNDTDTRAWADTWTAVNKNVGTLTVPSYEDYASLRDNCNYGYGIVYGDGSESVAKTLADAHGFTDYDNDGNDDGITESGARGVRACIVYNEINGDQVMFPLGAMGQGRRALATYTFNYDAAINGTYLQWMIPYNTSYNGALSYSGIGGLLYRPSSTGARNDCRPLTYNLYREPGAVYWFKQPYRKPWASTQDNDNRVAGWDINYYTLVFNPYDSSSLGKSTTTSTPTATTSSDALPIKLIYR